MKSIIKSMRYVNERNCLTAKRETGCYDGTIDILNSSKYTLSKTTSIFSPKAAREFALEHKAPRSFQDLEPSMEYEEKDNLN